MLKRTVVTLMVVAGMATLVALPAASARTAPARVGATTSQCPPGSGSANYCEHFCIVPRVDGGSLLTAAVKIQAADCRLGQINILPSRYAPKLTNSNRGLFTVVAQSPAPGTFHRFLYPVAVWVKYTG